MLKKKALQYMLLICTIWWKLGAGDTLPFRYTFSDAKAVFWLVNSFQSLGCSADFQPHTGWSELSGSAKGILQAVCSRLPFWLPLNKEKQQWS